MSNETTNDISNQNSINNSLVKEKKEEIQKASEILKCGYISAQTLIYFAEFFFPLKEEQKKDTRDLHIYLDERHNENDIVMMIFQIVIGYQFYFSNKIDYQYTDNRSTIRDPLPITVESLNIITSIICKRIFSEFYPEFNYVDMIFIINSANRGAFKGMFNKKEDYINMKKNYGYDYKFMICVCKIFGCCRFGDKCKRCKHTYKICGLLNNEVKEIKKCSKGKNCDYIKCLYDHPEGKLKENCRDDLNCTREICYSIHSFKPCRKAFCIFGDEKCKFGNECQYIH